MDSKCTLPPSQAKASQEPGSAQVVSGKLPAWVFASDQSDQHLSKTSEPTASHLTVQEVAAQLRVSERTVRRLISRGQLQVVRIGRSVRITPAAVGSMLEANTMFSFSTLDGSRD
jgi:excisionase family DNA binding protein